MEYNLWTRILLIKMNIVVPVPGHCNLVSACREAFLITLSIRTGMMELFIDQYPHSPSDQ